MITSYCIRLVMMYAGVIEDEGKVMGGYLCTMTIRVV